MKYLFWVWLYIIFLAFTFPVLLVTVIWWTKFLFSIAGLKP